MVNSLVSRVVIAIFFGSVMLACDQAGNTNSEPRSGWKNRVTTNPVDGTRTVQLLIGAVNRLPSQKDRAVLVLNCESGTTDVYVIWRQYLGVYDVEVSWRVGTDPAITETWSLSTDNEATFAPTPIELIKNMMNNDLFLIKTTPFGSAPVTIEFNTAGLKTEVAELRKSCGW